MNIKQEIRFWQDVDPADYIKSQELTEATVAGVLPAVLMSCGVKRPRVLDLGCGDGRLALHVGAALPRAGRIVGVDVSPTAVGLAVDAMAARKLKFDGWLCKDGRTLPDTGKKKFDAAYSVTVFQHLPLGAVLSYIDQVAARLKKGGIFRFQFVEGDSTTPLSQEHPIETISNACIDAGFDSAEVDRGVVHDVWTWITAIKG